MIALKQIEPQQELLLFQALDAMLTLSATPIDTNSKLQNKNIKFTFHNVLTIRKVGSFYLSERQVD